MRSVLRKICYVTAALTFAGGLVAAATGASLRFAVALVCTGLLMSVGGSFLAWQAARRRDRRLSTSIGSVAGGLSAMEKAIAQLEAKIQRTGLLADATGEPPINQLRSEIVHLDQTVAAALHEQSTRIGRWIAEAEASLHAPATGTESGEPRL